MMTSFGYIYTAERKELAACEKREWLLCAAIKYPPKILL